MSNTVAVVIPAYNVGPYIEATLESVLEQTTKADEIIVVDNNSKDDTLSIIKKFPVRLLEEKNKKGAGATRNCGIKAATSDWVAFLDGDDQFFPQKIEKLKSAINQNPQSVLIAHNEIEGPVGGPYIEKKLHEYFDAGKPALPQLFERCFLSTSTVAVRRDILMHVGGFDESFTLSQDYELWMRIVQHGKMIFIPETLSLYLLRPQSNSDNISLRHHFVTKIIDRYRNQVSIFSYLKRVLVLLAETTLALIQKRRLGMAAVIMTKGILGFPVTILRSFR